MIRWGPGPVPRTRFRTSFAAALLVAIALVPPQARAGEPAAPTLGATLAGVPVYANESRTLVARNDSALAEKFSVTIDGIGWSVEPASFELSPGEAQSITLIGIGPNRAILTVHVTSAVPVAGMQQGSIVLGAALYPVRPTDYSIIIVIVALALLGLVLGLWRVRRKVKRWTQNVPLLGRP